MKRTKPLCACNSPADGRLLPCATLSPPLAPAGFTVEICAAAVVILASRFDLPLSTTHAAVGAVAGIGLLEGRRAVNGRLFVKCVLGWVFTIIVVAATAAAFTAQTSAARRA